LEKDWSEILPLSSTELVSLNTKIPRELSEKLYQAKGMLQTTNRLLDYTKQVTVQVLLERGYASLLEDWERQDREASEESEKVVSLPRKRETLADRVARGETL
jgi:hypothetical protein